MEYIQLTMDDYIQSKKEIKENIGGIVKSFVRIGWQLTRINNSRAYEMDGYKNITEFARAEYGMTPDGVSRFMNVYEKFSLPGDTPELQEQYREFKFTQLTEMLQLPAEDQAMIQPETKREDIRELKKFNKENENNPENLLNWKEELLDKVPDTIREFFYENKEILNELYGSEAWQQGNIKQMVEIVNPSGARSYRKGTVFLMLYSFDKGVMVKEFGQNPEEMKWEKFFSITQEIFAEKAAGIRTWESYFAPVQLENKGETKEEPIVEEEQIPGQDSIMDHPEYMPKPEIAPAQKSEEQKYSEEQAKIDRETKKKLQEKEDMEKMSHLPSDSKEKKAIRMAYTNYDDFLSGRRSFDIQKGHFSIGDEIEYLEFKEGRATGRTLQAAVTYVLDEHSALEDGYCIISVKISQED